MRQEGAFFKMWEIKIYSYAGGTNPVTEKYTIREGAENCWEVRGDRIEYVLSVCLLMQENHVRKDTNFLIFFFSRRHKSNHYLNLSGSVLQGWRHQINCTENVRVILELRIKRFKLKDHDKFQYLKNFWPPFFIHKILMKNNLYLIELMWWSMKYTNVICNS